MNRRQALLTLSGLLLSPLAFAAGTPFETAAFDTARRSGKPVLVMVYAEWCPPCRKQDPAVQQVLKQPEFADVQLLTVDFDMQDDVLEKLKVSKQSTLLLFRGDKEIARSTGETRPEAIAQLLRKAR